MSYFGIAGDGWTLGLIPRWFVAGYRDEPGFETGDRLKSIDFVIGYFSWEVRAFK